MVTIFEFLGEDPIENVITCMNYRADKCVFFGYRAEITKQKKSLDHFLKKYCKTGQVIFVEVPHDDLKSTLFIMRRAIETEKGQRIFFDLTGGEDLPLVAFGMLAKEYDAPVHSYNVEDDRLLDFSSDRPTGISHLDREQSVKLDLDRFIELRGGIINYSLHKGLKDLDDPEYDSDIRKLWEVTCRHDGFWTSFSAFLRENMIPEKDYLVERKEETVLEALNKDNSELKTQFRLDVMLQDLADIGVITEYSRNNGKYHFRFKNENIKQCLWDGGSILELHTYQVEKERSDDCMMGVHLDWDGILSKSIGTDVYNEIDVLCLNGNVPSFISCKNGRMSGSTTLHALYELNIVAQRFGGKYAKKILVTTQPVGDVYLKRAAEMGIEVR